jgi:osmotically-inducible protein OsmY
MRRLLLLMTLPLLLSACPSLLISGAAEVAETVSENRSAGRKVDDKLLYADVYNQYSKANRTDLIAKVNLNTRFARLMLTGTVKSEDDKRVAEELAWKAANIEEVINELVVNPNKEFYQTANDSLVKRNLEARLLITKDVMVINYSLDIQSGVAYIIGRVKDQAELDRVLSVCKTTKGIHRVVSHLQINTDTDTPTKPSASGTSTNNTNNAIESAPIAAPYTPATGPIKTAPIPQDSAKPGY